MFSLLLVAVFILTVLGFLAFDLRTAWNFFHDNEEISAQERSFFDWWWRTGKVKTGIAVGLILPALLPVLFPGLVVTLRDLEFQAEFVGLALLYVVIAAFFAYDLNVARTYYRNNLELAGGEIPFFSWWLRLSVAKLTGAALLAAGGLLLALFPDFRIPAFPFPSFNPLLLLAVLAVAGFFVYDLKAAHNFYLATPELAGGEVSFIRWWLRLSTVKIGSVAALVVGGLLLHFLPDFRIKLPDIPITFTQVLLLTGLLVVAGYLWFDLKMAREHHEELTEAHPEEELESFFRWWLRQNTFSLGAAVCFVAIALFILVFPEKLLIIRQAKLNIRYPLALAGALSFLVLFGGFLAFDIYTARKYFHNNPAFSSGEVTFFRWWCRVNAVKFVTTVGLVLILAVVVTFDLGVVFNKTKAATSQALKEKPKPPPRPANTADSLAMAQWYLKQQKFKEASLEYRNAIQKNPKAIEAHLGLAKTQMVLGDYKTALQSYQNAVRQDPASYPARLELGQFYLGANAGNDPEQAIEQLTQANRLRPDELEPVQLLAHAYIRTGKADLAIRNCRVVLDKAPAAPAARSLLINIYLSRKAYAEALKEAEAGLTHTPTSTELKILKASALEALGRFQDAEATLRKAAEQDAASPDPFLYLGDMKQRHRKYAEAIRAYEDALSRTPDHAGAMNNVAMLTVDHASAGGNIDRAYRLAKQLYDKHPGNPLYADTMGWVYNYVGYLDQALDILKKASAQLPDEAQVRYHLGAVMLKKGDRAGALKELTAALEKGNDFDGADQARILLKTLTVGEKSRKPKS